MEALPRGSGEFALYTTERFFTEPTGNVGGYSIPLPRGRYRVTLRFAEGHFTVPGSRVFDVLLEGETVLAEYEPLRNGFGFPDARTFPVDVMDGVLNIDFRVRIENPKISAFEVSRE
jgi:hypothetical protein